MVWFLIVLCVIVIFGIIAACSSDDFPGWFVFLWLLWATVCLSVTGGVIYVAWHFISKYW